MNIPPECIGRKILDIRIDDDLIIEFEDRSCLSFMGGQEWSQHTYMETDDEVEVFFGSTFLGVELDEVKTIEDKGWEHEIQFLRILTSDGPLTICSHNKYDGWYGAFNLEVFFREGL